MTLEHFPYLLYPLTSLGSLKRLTYTVCVLFGLFNNVISETLAVTLQRRCQGFLLYDTLQAFKSIKRIYTFISSCDYKKWDSQAVKDYYVFATPTIYLLQNTILIPILKTTPIVQRYFLKK